MSEVRIRIEGLELKSPNRQKGTTRGAMLAHAHHTKVVKTTVQLHVASKGLRGRGLPASVHFVSVSPRRLDADNHIASWKAAADGMCKALGFDDKSLVIAEVREGVQATFEQRTTPTEPPIGRARQWVGVEIHIRYP